MGWILPIGTPGGINSGFDGVPDGSGLVRLGEDLMYLEPHRYRLWRAAAAAQQLEDLIEWATADGIAGAADLVRTTTEAGLLIDESSGASRLDGLAMRLVGECIGNGSQGDSRFVVAGRSGSLVAVDPYLFEILLRSDGVTPVGTVCKELDACAPRPDGTACIDILAASLPTLVGSQVVRLDAVMA